MFQFKMNVVAHTTDVHERNMMLMHKICHLVKCMVWVHKHKKNFFDPQSRHIVGTVYAHFMDISAKKNWQPQLQIVQ